VIKPHGNQAKFNILHDPQAVLSWHAQLQLVLEFWVGGYSRIFSVGYSFDEIEVLWLEREDATCKKLKFRFDRWPDRLRL